MSRASQIGLNSTSRAATKVYKDRFMGTFASMIRRRACGVNFTQPAKLTLNYLD